MQFQARTPILRTVDMHEKFHQTYFFIQTFSVTSNVRNETCALLQSPKSVQYVISPY